MALHIMGVGFSLNRLWMLLEQTCTTPNNELARGLRQLLKRQECLFCSHRALLRQYEQRPPPLAPLAAALRSLSTLCDDLEAPASTSRPADSSPEAYQ